MGAFGIKGKEQWPDQEVRNHGNGFYDAHSKKISDSAKHAECRGFAAPGMPVRAAFFAQAEKKLEKGVYTKKKAPYNLLSLLIAESPKQAADL